MYVVLVDTPPCYCTILLQLQRNIKFLWSTSNLFCIFMHTLPQFHEKPSWYKIISIGLGVQWGPWNPRTPCSGYAQNVAHGSSDKNMTLLDKQYQTIESFSKWSRYSVTKKAVYNSAFSVLLTQKLCFNVHHECYLFNKCKPNKAIVTVEAIQASSTLVQKPQTLVQCHKQKKNTCTYIMLNMYVHILH